jgi:hypothetical protein
MSARKKQTDLIEAAAAAATPSKASRESVSEMMALAESAATSGVLKNGRFEEPIAQFSLGNPKKDFFQVYPEPENGYKRMQMIEGGKVGNTPKEWFVVLPNVLTEIGEMVEGSGIKTHTLIPVIDRVGNVRVWPVPDPTSEMGEKWHRSRLKVIAEATTKWVRTLANNSESRYDLLAAIDQSLEPKWPEETYPEILQKALGGCFIQTTDHPVIQAIVGK